MVGELVGRAFPIAAAGDGLAGRQVLGLVGRLDVVRGDLLHQLPQDDGLREVAALLEQPGQGPVEGRVLRVLLPGLVEDEHGVVDQPEGVGRLGHVHLGADVPRVLGQDQLAVFEDLQVVARPLGRFQPGPQAMVVRNASRLPRRLFLYFAFWVRRRVWRKRKLAGSSLQQVSRSWMA